MINVGIQTIEINNNLYFTQIGIVKFCKNLHIGLIAQKQFFQIKILNDINFFTYLHHNPIQSVYLFSLKVYLVY